jgi:Transmembrane domain of unknown function (DUF3566)
MATVRRVGPGSAFKIGLILYGILGLLLGIVMACISMVAGSFGGLGHSAVPGAGGTATAVSWDLRSFAFGTGFGAIIFFPLLYGLFGGIFAAVGAVLYNLVAGWVGGLEVDIS